MKDQTISNINKLGKVSRIIIIFLKIFVIVGIVASIFVGIALLAIPEDAIKLDIASAKADIVADYDAFPIKLVSVDVSDSSINFLGSALRCSVQEEKNDDGSSIYRLDAFAENVEWGELKLFIVMGMFALAIFFAALMIALIFGQRLAKALESCNSPFEENVLKAMQSFGKSLIPLAVIFVVARGVFGIANALAIIVVILFIQIFKYGAKLQQESDETL